MKFRTFVPRRPDFWIVVVVSDDNDVVGISSTEVRSFPYVAELWRNMPTDGNVFWKPL